MTRPLMSVVTITRNNRAALERTRRSVQTQTYKGIEHIVIDAASTDGTQEWLQSQNHDLRWVSEADGGRYHGMNKGSRLATGDLLWFLHAGDAFAASDVVELVIRDWQLKRWRWAYGAARLVAGDRGVVGINAPIPFRLRRFSLGEAVLPHQAACFEASLFEELGGYDEKFGVAADQLFMLQAALVCAPTTIAEFLCDFDLSGAGSSRSPFWHFYDSARARHRTGTLVRGGAGVVDALAFVALATAESLKRGLSGRLRVNQ